VSIFCSGHTGFTQGMFEKLSLKPYVVHATFQFSGTPGKRHRMRERLWWNVSFSFGEKVAVLCLQFVQEMF
jgi:hypothetical protein